MIKHKDLKGFLISHEDNRKAVKTCPYCLIDSQKKLIRRITDTLAYIEQLGLDGVAKNPASGVSQQILSDVNLIREVIKMHKDSESV